jgi:uncharacterized protein (TIGR02001 family)
MKTRLLSFVGAAVMLGSAYSAQAVEIAGNVTIASDYSFRGVSQTDRDPAIQGGFDVAFEPGFYLGTWGSNVSGFVDTSMEWDLYGGFAGQITEEVGYDLRYIRYEYPGNGDTYDYNEYHAMLKWNGFIFGVGYSDEYFALEEVVWWYPNVEYSLSLPAESSLVFKAGMSMTDDGDDLFTDSFGDEDVLDWSVTYKVPVAGVTLGIGVVGTDIDDDDCYGGMKICETRAIVSVSKSM